MSTFFQIFLEKFRKFSVAGGFFIECCLPVRQEFINISLDLSLLSAVFCQISLILGVLGRDMGTS
jgi:hypothetical protein